MDSEVGFDATQGSPKDLDAVVSNFLAELDALSAELQPEFPKAEPAPIPAIPTPAAAPAVLPTPHKSRSSPIFLLTGLAIIIAFAGYFYFRPAEVRTVSKPKPPAVSQPEVLSVAGPLNDSALLLAGLPVEPHSRLYRLSATAPFERHRREMRTFWDRIRQEHLANIRQWREENIPARFESNPVLYPLSGADYLNAYAFFPRASDYLLLALEPPGSIPDLGALSEQEIDEGLAAIRRNLQSIAAVNYLQSKSMREDLTNSAFGGIAPLLVLFAAGFGHTIRDVHPVTISPDGQLIQDGQEDTPKSFRRVAGISVPENDLQGIQIEFVDGADGTAKTITYLQIELRNEVFGGSGAEARFLLGLKNRNCILKSAVYLLHGNDYDKVRSFILASSDLVIQDDSGIPYRDFLHSEWEEHLFGKYTRAQPLGTLTNPPQQPLLAQQYALESHPLSFPYGYGVLWGKDRSNLMLFVKKK